MEIIKERNERYLSLFGSWLDLFDGASLIIIKFEVKTQITSDRTRDMKKRSDKKNIAVFFNAAILVMTVFGYILAFLFPQENRLPNEGGLGLRYFTTLSNFFAGAAAFIVLIYLIRNKQKESLPVALARLKLMAAAAVMVTFLVVIGFLGPMYGFEKLYAGSNFFYHLVIPLTTMADYCFVELIEKNPFRDTAFATIPVLLYGTVYLTNIAINGVGEWPYGNDWYGFTSWGIPMTFVIFGLITLISWIFAVIMRGIRQVIQKRKGR